MLLFALPIFSILPIFRLICFSGHLYHSVPDLLWGHPTAPLSVLPPPYSVAASFSFSSCASSHLLLKGLPPGSRPSTLPQPLHLILPCLPSLITGQRPLHNSAMEPKKLSRLKFLQKYTIFFFNLKKNIFKVSCAKKFIYQQCRGLIKFLFWLVFLFVVIAVVLHLKKLQYRHKIKSDFFAVLS